MGVSTALKAFKSGIGFDALLSSSRDMKLLILLRMIRLFACGGATLILALYLSALQFSDASIGLFMTLTLVGDLVISVLLTYIGDGMGVRVTMALGSLLMAGSGIAFAFLDNYWLLLLASIAGVINPSANEVDPFKAIEESAIARLSPPEQCSDFFAWWSLLGMFGTAASTLLTGFAVERLQAVSGFSAVESYKIMFLAYAAVGVVKLLCSFLVSRQVELNSCPDSPNPADKDHTPDDQTPLLGSVETQYSTVSPAKISESKPESVPPARLFTPQSFSFMWKLSLAMALDFVGSGLAQISWMSYFFKREYHVGEDELGIAIFVASLVSSVLNLASSPLSRSIGQIQTMVVCHTINSISLLMISVPNKNLALMLLIFRIVTRELDNAPRQAFISAGVLNEERTSAMGCVNVVKTVGSCLGLYLTGQFAGMGKFWIAFMVAGCLKLGYNVLIVAFFWNHKARTA
ncbi:hypothetical protein HYFRA_00010841 [Hymenoscyphus fraxineus]|uniref:Major facilitator superfamily (MFS) profile domain-containing protein n=1 Tax=Hymenoscyphus fraxineus TaxID=746836 RepID=A0A9N9KXE8_9HELO|nr:hypothetical protein HYFRA_00010841 [Hymenoscyphus fraxineus]